MTDDQWTALVGKLARAEDALLRQADALEVSDEKVAIAYVREQWRIALDGVSQVLDEIAACGVLQFIFVASFRGNR